MTVVDSSVLLAILFGEPDAHELAGRLAAYPRPLMSAATLVEIAIVADKNPSRLKGPAIEDLIANFDISLVPFDLEQARIARTAYRRFGKGNHPAGLNFGDCFSYALAKAHGLPLLFKGDDFGLTDIEVAAG